MSENETPTQPNEPVVELATVPNVVGLSNKDAFTAITVARLSVGFNQNQNKEKKASQEGSEGNKTNTAVPDEVLSVATIREVPGGVVSKQDPQAGTTIPVGHQVVLSSDYNLKRKTIIIGAVFAVIIAALLAGLFFGYQTQNNVKVPKLTYSSQTIAETSITSAGLKVGTVTKQESLSVPGTVLSQDPAAGVTVKKGTSVNIVVAELTIKPVINVVGMKIDKASKTIQESGFTVGTITRLPSSKAPGVVLAQNPIAKSIASDGSKIDLVVSSGSNIVPSVFGKTLEEAKTTLTEEGLVTKVKYTATLTQLVGKVVNQTPAAGTVAKDGSTVVITVGKAAPTPSPTPTVTPTPTPTVTPTPKPKPSKPTPTPTSTKVP